MSEFWPSRSGSTQVFIFDKQYSVCLRIGELIVLEERTKTPIGRIWKHLEDAEWTITELLEITRLGLIGGGMSPEDAAGLLDACYRTGYLMRFGSVAAKIMMAALVGIEEDDPNAGEPKAPATASSPSAGAKSSPSAHKRGSRPVR